MSHLSVILTQGNTASYLSSGAVLSFEQHTARIHLSGQEPLKNIKKAARTLDGMGTEKVSLQGEWTLEQQWAFATAFTTAKKQFNI